MTPAVMPRPARSLRILVVDATSGARRAVSSTKLHELLEPGDLVVVNDASTLPASLDARTVAGAAIELRLAGAVENETGVVRFRAALLGAGDHHTRTEDRPAPPDVAVGEALRVGDELVARVIGAAAFSPRLVELELSLVGRSAPRVASTSAIWAALYRSGKPVQYAHVPEPLALWDVQNVFAGRPWAVEMPSAGRVLRIESLLDLRRRGIEIASVTHAAGLSATGDPAIDARLPLPERFEVPERTARAVARAKARGGRVLAVGTSVVRSLESFARGTTGTTDLLLGPGVRRLVVDGLLTGVHDSDTTHFELLGAFVERGVLDSALATAAREELYGHEFGDAWLVWGTSPGCASSVRASSATVAA